MAQPTADPFHITNAQFEEIMFSEERIEEVDLTEDDQREQDAFGDFFPDYMLEAEFTAEDDIVNDVEMEEAEEPIVSNGLLVPHSVLSAASSSSSGYGSETHLEKEQPVAKSGNFEIQMERNIEQRVCERVKNLVEFAMSQPDDSSIPPSLEDLGKNLSSCSISPSGSQKPRNEAIKKALEAPSYLSTFDRTWFYHSSYEVKVKEEPIDVPAPKKPAVSDYRNSCLWKLIMEEDLPVAKREITVKEEKKEDVAVDSYFGTTFNYLDDDTENDTKALLNFNGELNVGLYTTPIKMEYNERPTQEEIERIARKPREKYCVHVPIRDYEKYSAQKRHAPPPAVPFGTCAFFKQPRLM